MNCDQALIPIACRFVGSDQWLTAHFDSTWKISEVKQYILSKVYNRTIAGNDNIPSEDRPVSPITFASVGNSFSSNPEFSLDDDLFSDLEPYPFMEPARQLRPRHTPTPRVTSPPIPESPTEPLAAAPLPPHHYPLLAFSTGQLLEDDYSLAWYRLCPHELLELHPPGTIVRLQREVMLEYVKPYLELDVRALRVISNDKDSHALSSTSCSVDTSSPNKIKKSKEPAPGDSRGSLSVGCGGSGVGSPAPPSMRKRRKMKLEWRDRYLVIRQGMLSLFKSRTGLAPLPTRSLMSLTTLRGQEDVVHTAAAAMPSPHVVCAKFRTDACATGGPEPHSLSPTAEQWNDPWSGGTVPREADGHLWGRRESKEDIKQQSRSTAECGDTLRGNAFPKEDFFEGRTPDVKGESPWCDINVGDGTQGTWLILDTLDGFAHSNLLRVLHRCSPDTISTTLIPTYLLPDSSFSSSASSPPPFYTGGLRPSARPYPEWRIEVCQRAQQSGLGGVSDAMGWILCGGLPLGPSDLKYSGTELRKKPSQATMEDSSTLGPFHLDVDDDGGDGNDCELEWDLWAMDLTRQALANVSSNNVDAVTEPLSTHPTGNHPPHHRIRPTTSASTFSSVTLSEQAFPTSPTFHRPGDIVPGANMGLLSEDSPALLTAPSVLPFQSTGVTTSTVSAGGVVRTRSLLSVDGSRGRGVARAMEIVAEDGREAHSFGRHRAGRRKRAGEESTSRGAVHPASAPARSVATVSANTITSTVTVHESSTPSPTQSHGSPFWEASSSLVGAPTPSSSSVVMATATGIVPGGGLSPPPDDTSVISGIASSVMTTMTTTTTTMIPLLARRSSTAGETLRPDTSASGPLSPKRSDNSKAVKGKGKAKETKVPSRGKPFSPERLMSKLEPALDFVTG